MGRDGSIVFLMKVMNIFCKKHIKMENKEQDFINRYKNVQESIVKAMDKALERAIGNKVIDFEKCEGNYLDVYPLIGAVLQKELRSVLSENVNKSISRNMKIKATKYRNDYRVWLAVQELAHDGRWTQAAEELVSSCGLTEDECRELQEESGSFNDEMLDFINSVFGHEDMINNSITLENIGYHKIGSIFKYNIGSKEVELEVVESSDASCEGCVFNNSKNYYCKDTHCIDVDRKDDIDVIYKEVKRS